MFMYDNLIGDDVPGDCNDGVEHVVHCNFREGSTSGMYAMTAALHPED